MIGKLISFRRATPNALSDEALLAACAVGDMTALGQLFEKFADPIYGFLSRLLNTHGEELDDLVQATFLEVYRSASQFKNMSSAKTWIIGVAANMARHHIRSEVRRRNAVTNLERQDPSKSARPDETAEHRQLLAKIGAVLEKLPHDLQVAFVLCDLEQLSGAEASQALGVKEGTLSRRLYEARKALRSALEVS
jgi:RNA polymerase sigma-70 factor, ECF subfamily